MSTLSRYTSILAVLDTLANRRLTLVDPKAWADQNDREVMAVYANAHPGHRVFAYCMAEGAESAHHWQVFAQPGAGACIKFSQERLFAALADQPHLRHEAISYVAWRELKVAPAAIPRLPFVKRGVFRYEREYRIVATVPGAAALADIHHVSIPLECITSVYISGDVPPSHFETLLALIKRIPDCDRLIVRHSKLLGNENWSRSLNAALLRRAPSSAEPRAPSMDHPAILKSDRFEA